MATIKVLKSQFVYSVPSLSLMRPLEPEVAMVGRSNVGKSSLINAICHKKDLARTSKLPGRTRHAVVYELLLAKDDR
ncbi:MAG TPA: GTPase, partial [Myxococcota bacterium]|nr:GTPase [Myxococcota bacterium]